MPSILDDLITAYDEDPDSRQIAQKPPLDPATFQVAREIAEITHHEQAYRRPRARSKQVKDQAHGDRLKERRRIFQEAHRDVLSSPGEVDSKSSSKILGVVVAGKFEGIVPGDVLRDPKLRNTTNGYVYSALRR